MTDLDDPRILQIERTGYLNEKKDLTICEHCGEVIDYMSFRINGEILCIDCVRDTYGKRI